MHLSLACFLWFTSFKTGSTVYVLGEAVVAVQWRDGSRTLRTCLWRVSYGSRHSRWARRCASLDKAVLAARQRRDGIGLYALVFGVFPMVHVIQYGLDGARPSEVVGRTTSGNIATTLGLLENLVSTTSFPPSSFDVVSLRYLALRYVLA